MTKSLFKISKLKPSAFQAKFDFDAASKRQHAALAIEHPIERLMFTMLALLLALLFFAYFYFVVGSVLNIINRREADTRSQQVQGVIGELESQYFALSQSLTPDSASSIGLSPIGSTQYVYRPGNAASADVSNHTI